MIILGVDPGPRTSGAVVYDSDKGRVVASWSDACVIRVLNQVPGVEMVCAERVKWYGPNVNAGRDVFETCENFGEFRLAAQDHRKPFHWRYRPDVNRHLTGLPTAQKSQVRTAIADRFGGRAVCKGTKKNPGPLYGLSGHGWDALAVVLTVLDESTVLEERS